MLVLAKYDNRHLNWLFIISLQATDGDFDDKLTYRIIDGTMEVTDSSLQQWQNRDPFRIQENTLLLNFNVQDSALKGLFKFNLEVMDTGLFIPLKGRARLSCLRLYSYPLHTGK